MADPMPEIDINDIPEARGDAPECRICGGGAEPDAPLFYPCKCSGTIRYIHQGCLTTWLKHKKNSSCDICKHPYAFQKVYAPGMPKYIPVFVFAKQVCVQIISSVAAAARAWLVALAWLLVVPYLTVWVWRFYFWSADQFAWTIYGPLEKDEPPMGRPNSTDTLSVMMDFVLSSAYSINDTVSEFMDVLNMTTYLFDHPDDAAVRARLEALRKQSSITITSDILTGQIITAMLVVVFLGLFLLREWVVQNAPAGMLEEEGEEDEQGQLQELVEGEQQLGQVARVAVVAVPQPPGPLEEEPAGEFLPLAFDDPPPPLALDVLPATPVLLGLEFPVVPEQAPPSPIREEVDPVEADATYGSDPLEPEGMSQDDSFPLWVDEFDFLPTGPSTADDGEATPLAGTPTLASPTPSYIPAPGTVAPPLSSPPLPTLATPSRLPLPTNRTFSSIGIETDPVDSDDEMEAEASGLRPLTPYLFQGTKGKGKAPATAAEEINKEKLTFKFDLPSSSRRPNGYNNLVDTASRGPFVFAPTNAPPPSTPPNPGLFPPEATVNTLYQGDFQSFAASLSSSDGPSDLGTKYFLGPSTEPLNSEALPSVDLSGSAWYSAGRPSDPEFRPPFSRPQLPPSTPNHERPISALPFPLTAPTASSSAIPPRPPLGLPTPSPGLATYQAPEQLNDYFRLQPQAAPLHYEPGFRRLRRDSFGEIPENSDGDMSPDLAIPGQFPEDGAIPRPRLEIRWQEPPPPPPPEPLPQFEPQIVVDPAAEVVDEMALGEPLLLEDDFEDEGAEEMEGAMEAIGMRGPVGVLLQNMMLVMVILYSTMGVGVWIPYTIGKTAGLLTLRPRRTLFLIDIPLRIVRVLTDPIFDALWWLIRRFTRPFHPILSLLGLVWKPSPSRESATHLKTFAKLGVGLSKMLCAKMGETGWRALVNLQYRIQKAACFAFPVLGPAPELTADQLDELYKLTARKMEQDVMRFVDIWIKLVKGSGNVERAFAIAFGYCVATLVVGTVLEAAGPHIGRSMRIVRNIIRQHLVVTKVAIFVVAELICFPIGCGALIDFMSRLFCEPGGIGRSIAFYNQSWFTSIFLHWMLGTMYMYQAALGLSTIRSFLRPGAIWFINDPSDPNFHPIRDIIDRPFGAQFRKITSNIGIYYTHIVLCMSAARGLAVWMSRNTEPVLPLHTSLLDPLSEIPIDLLFLHFVIPITLSRLRPLTLLKNVCHGLWAMLSRNLRLSSYMMGIDAPEEEQFDPSAWPVRLWRWWKKLQPPTLVHRGTRVRVPALDALPLPPRPWTFIEVDDSDQPVNEKGWQRKHYQDEVCISYGADPATSFTVIYRPPNFKLRLAIFTVSMWTFLVYLICQMIFLPIMLGRKLISLANLAPVHDVYTWTIGVYTALGVLLLIKEIKRLHRKRPTPQRFAKKVFFKAPQVIYMALMLGVVIPLLTSLAVDVLLVHPVRIWLGYPGKPHIHLVESWACGVLYIRIGMKAHGLDARNPLYVAFMRVLSDGYRNPDAWRATKDIFQPVIPPLVFTIVVPFLIVAGLRPLKIVDWVQDEQAALRYVSPAIAWGSLLVSAINNSYAMLLRWAQKVRDRRYLVELRLTNLEEPQAPEQKQEEQAHADGEAVA